MNAEKGESQDVADPFALKPESFVMEFPSLMIRSGSKLTPSEREKTEATIRRLKLNEKEKYIEARREWLCAYCDGEITLAFLKKMAPFIAYELKRQKLEERIVSVMRSDSSGFAFSSHRLCVTPFVLLLNLSGQS